MYALAASEGDDPTRRTRWPGAGRVALAVLLAVRVYGEQVRSLGSGLWRYGRRPKFAAMDAILGGEEELPGGVGEAVWG